MVGSIRKGTVGLLVVAAFIALLPGVASAGFIRSFSDINFAGDDIRFCEDTITIEGSVSHQTGSFEGSYPGFDGTVGTTPYPGGDDSLALYASAADVQAAFDADPDNNPDPVVTVTFPLILEVEGASAGSAYIFRGQGTIPTPAGYTDGSQLWVYAIDNDFNVIPQGFTIGDAAYACEPDPPATQPLDFDLWAWRDWVRVNAFWPYAVTYDTADVDIATLSVSADNSADSAAVQHLYMWHGWGVGLVNMNDAGVDCGSTAISLSGVGNDGVTPYEGTHPVTPRGRSCR